jgi:hypothetical protein
VVLTSAPLVNSTSSIPCAIPTGKGAVGGKGRGGAVEEVARVMAALGQGLGIVELVE